VFVFALNTVRGQAGFAFCPVPSHLFHADQMRRQD
jgi:hypothetical protein